MRAVLRKNRISVKSSPYRELTRGTRGRSLLWGWTQLSEGLFRCLHSDDVRQPRQMFVVQGNQDACGVPCYRRIHGVAPATSVNTNVGSIMGSPCTRSSSNSWRLVAWSGSRWSNPFTHTLALIMYMGSPTHSQHGFGQRLALRGARSGKLLPQLEERRPGIGRFGATGYQWLGRDHLGKPTCQIGQELHLIVRGQLIHQALRLIKCTLRPRVLL